MAAQRASIGATARLPATSRRLGELDGIRGWAALSVVLFHVTWETFGAVAPSLRNPVTGFLLDGGIAVSAFFVLSGEALSAGYFAGGGRLAVYRLALKRYTRLTIPIIGACTLTWLLYKTGLTYNATASRIVHRPDWLGSFMQVAPDLRHSIEYMLFDVYTNVPTPHALIPFLWTMRFELMGSLLVFGILLGLSRLRGLALKGAWVFIAVLCAATIYGRQDNLSCFLAGVMFARLRSLGFFGRMQSDRHVQTASWLIILIVGTLDGFSHWLVTGRAWVPLASVVLVFATLCNRRLCAAFSNSLSRALGRLSFPLYLVQFPVLVSFTSFAICFAAQRGNLGPWTIAGICCLSLIACLAAARAFISVERITRWVGDGLSSIVLSSRVQPRGDEAVSLATAQRTT